MPKPLLLFGTDLLAESLRILPQIFRIMIMYTLNFHSIGHHHIIIGEWWHGTEITREGHSILTKLKFMSLLIFLVDSS